MQFPKTVMLLHFSLAVALLSLANVSPAQETQRQKQEQNTQQNQYRDQAQATQIDQTQRNSESYVGKVSEKYGKFYLEVAHTRSSYVLDGFSQTKRFVNKKVRVTGSLDTDKNILHAVSISLAP
jgi:Tfp pilus assembly protein PilV